MTIVVLQLRWESEMSRTIRRKNCRVFEQATVFEWLHIIDWLTANEVKATKYFLPTYGYVVHGTWTDEQIKKWIKKRLNYVHSDCMKGRSAPKNFRQIYNRKLRHTHKKELITVNHEIECTPFKRTVNYDWFW